MVPYSNFKETRFLNCSAPWTASYLLRSITTSAWHLGCWKKDERLWKSSRSSALNVSSWFISWGTMWAEWPMNKAKEWGRLMTYLAHPRLALAHGFSPLHRLPQPSLPCPKKQMRELLFNEFCRLKTNSALSTVTSGANPCIWIKIKIKINTTH